MQIEHGQKCPKCEKKLTKFAHHSSCHHCGEILERYRACPQCGAPGLPTQIPEVYSCGTHNWRLAAEASPEPPKPTVLKPGQKQYFVVTQADQWWMGKFSPDRMTHLLNKLASSGWRLVTVAASDRSTWFGTFGNTARQEMVLFLERIVEVETEIPDRELTVADIL